MENLNLPDYKSLLNINTKENTIFDPCRKKHVSLTPEEWVRQNFIWHMAKALHYPLGLLSIEMALKLNGLSRRCDIVGFDSAGKARLIVECKAPKVKINQSTFTQVATYNLKLAVDYLIVTNGLSHYCCKMDYSNNSYTFLEALPDFGLIK